MVYWSCLCWITNRPFNQKFSRLGETGQSLARGVCATSVAQVPQSESLRYAIDLESITAGRGHFTLAFSHYQELPANLAEKIMADAKVAEDED